MCLEPLTIPTRDSRSSQSTDFFSKILNFASSGWKAFKNTKTVSRSDTRSLTRLLDSHEQADRELGQSLQSCIRRLGSCSVGKPCGIIGCRKCGIKKTYTLAKKAAEITSAYSIARKGRVAVIRISSYRYEGDLITTYREVRRDMCRLQKYLKQINKVAGFRLTLDISLSDLAGKDKKFNRKALNTYTTLPLHLHIHGTVLLHKGIKVSDFELDVQEFFIQQQKDVKLWSQYLKGTYCTKTNKQRSDVCGIKDTLRWSLYQEKLQHGGKLPKAMQQFIRIHLAGKPRVWTGGELAITQPKSLNLDNVHELAKQISQIRNLTKCYPKQHAIHAATQSCRETLQTLEPLIASKLNKNHTEPLTAKKITRLQRQPVNQSRAVVRDFRILKLYRKLTVQFANLVYEFSLSKSKRRCNPQTLDHVKNGRLDKLEIFDWLTFIIAARKKIERDRHNSRLDNSIMSELPKLKPLTITQSHELLYEQLLDLRDTWPTILTCESARYFDWEKFRRTWINYLIRLNRNPSNE